MIIDSERCTGCGACLQVCSCSAINWEKNREGFDVPVVDENKCIDCGLCRKVCPYETERGDADPEVYAAVHKDPEVVKKSSSGGAFTAVSDWILEQGGVVYGVAFDKKLEAHYLRAENEKKRNQMRGTKYLQCPGNALYGLVEKDLRDQKTVLVTGTPCQLSGLSLVLKQKKVPSERLYLIDNICHGVASPLVFDEYLKYIRSTVLKSKEIRKFSMRSKKVSWQKQYLDCRTEAGDESRILNKKASWNKLYQTTYFIRPSCYSCRFTSYDRVGDMTFGDYWNIENAGVSLDHSKGISLILVNTEKGRELLEASKDRLLLEKSDKNKCWQIHLERPLPRPKKREVIWENFYRNPSGVIAKCAKGSAFSRLFRSVGPILKKLGLYNTALRMFSLVKSNGKKS